MTVMLSHKTFKALSALLTYPTEELSAAIPEITAALAAERLVSNNAIEQLHPLLGDLCILNLYDLQERYVELFDKTRRHSLHLFEHIHGESRDRGQAMVDLVEHYQRAGLLVTANELPDFIPLFLEFLSDRPLEEVRGLLNETAHISRCWKSGSPSETGDMAPYSRPCALSSANPLWSQLRSTTMSRRTWRPLMQLGKKLQSRSAQEMRPTAVPLIACEFRCAPQTATHGTISDLK